MQYQRQRANDADTNNSVFVVDFDSGHDNPAFRHTRTHDYSSSPNTAAAAAAAGGGDGDGGYGDYDIMDDDYAEEVHNRCISEMRINFSGFAGKLQNQASELVHAVSKLDFKKALGSCCSLEGLKQRVPIIKWAPSYRMEELQGDLIAGMTVGLTVIPQSIAYAGIANVGPQYGLYSSFIGSFIYVLFGSSKDITLGPSAIMSLMTASYGQSPIPNDPTFAIWLGFFTGIVQVIMYIIGFGYLMDFISFPVMKAFTTAAAITIGMSQVKKWFGLSKVPGDFIPQLVQTIQKIPQTRLWDFLMGVVSIFFIVLFKKMKEVPWKLSLSDMPLYMKILNKTVWFIGTARNIIVLVVASVVAFIFLENHMKPFSLIGYIPPGIPPFAVPKTSVYDPATNRTYTVSDIAQTVGLGMIVVPLIGLIEAMSIGKVYARKFNYKFDSNQEFLPYGIANILTAFVMGYVGTGTFSRTAVNAASGVKTPAGGIVTGVLVLLALQFLTPLFYYIPSAALAVVIIMAVVDTMTFHKVWIFWKTKRIDLIPWIVTFILSFVLSVEYGIAIGAVVSLLILLYPTMRPTFKVYQPVLDGPLKEYVDLEGYKLIIVELSSSLLYPAVDYIKDQIIAIGQADAPKGVVLDFQHVADIDTTTVQGVRELLADLHKKEITVVVCNLPKRVDVTFRRAKPKYFIKASNIKESVDILLGRSPDDDSKCGASCGNGGVVCCDVTNGQVCVFDNERSMSVYSADQLPCQQQQQQQQQQQPYTQLMYTSESCCPLTSHVDDSILFNSRF